MYGIVYCALNLINDKVYIGQTTGTLFARTINHFTVAKINKCNYYFYKALREYEKSDWEWNILQLAYCKAELDALEKYWIWILNSMIPNGYNTKEGGSYGKHTKETRQKMSETQKGNTKGKGNKDRINTKEHYENMSKALKGLNMGAYNPNARIVQCIETGKIYGAIAEAARKTGINKTGISNVINKRKWRKTAGGFHWRFV